MQKTRTEHTAFYKWGKWAAQKRRWVLLAWVITILAAAMIAPQFQKNVKSTSMFVRHSDVQKAETLISTQFEKTTAEQDMLVFQAKTSLQTDNAYRTFVQQVTAEVANVREIKSIVTPLGANSQAQQLISKDGTTAIAILSIDGNHDELKAIAKKINNKLNAIKNHPAYGVYLTGTTPMMNDMIDKQGGELAKAEMVGIPVAIVVLLLAFGSLIAASLPIVLSMFGLMVTFGALGVLSFFHSFDMTVQSMTSMIGLGVGIDYVLFIVRRYREELALGRTTNDAVAYTMATTGKAIFFSGITVLIAMAGLFWLQATLFTNMAIGTILVVAVMMAISLTLLPAVLAMLGERVNRFNILRFRKRTSQTTHANGSKAWHKWSTFVLKNPKRWASLGIVLLLLLTTQAFQMKLGMDTGAKTITDTPSGRGMAIVNATFSAGLISPVSVVVHQKDGQLTESNWKELAALVARIGKEKAVYRVESIPGILQQQGISIDAKALNAITKSPLAANLKQIWNFDKTGDTTLIRVTLHDASDSTNATKWVRTLRDKLIPATVTSDNVDVFVGGSSMAIAELSDETWHKTPYVIVTVLALSYLLLLLAFRSWLIPLKAILLNLLSVGASFGLLVWVFMGGHGSWLGIDQIAFVQVFLPVIAFAVLFGLSMDYEVFLVSRIKEEWGRTQNVDEAISNGIAHTSGPITQAAIIMISVFLAFLLTKGDTQQIGFALGMAILIDVTIVRSLLVPTLMKWLGEKAWRLPNWLDRIVPHVDLAEGEAGKQEV